MTHFTDALWNVGWRAAILLTIVAIGTRLVPRRALALRSALLQIGLWSLLVLPFTLAAPRLTLPLLPVHQVTTSERNPATEPDAARSVASSAPGVVASDTASVTPLQTVNANPTIIERAHPENADPVAPRDLPVVAVDSVSTRAPGQASLPTRRGPGMWDWPAIVSAVYGTGLLILLVRLVIGLWQVRRLHQHSLPNPSAIWDDDLLEYCRVLHIAWPVRLRVSPHISTPLTFGWWKPVVVVPAVMIEGLDQLQRRAVLLHELTHIQRGDFAAQLAMHVAQACYWYQPLIWLLGRDLRACQEDLCDAECSAEFGNATYSSLLVQIVQSLQPVPVLTLTLAMARRSRLARRLTQIQSHTEATTLRLTRIAIGLTLAIAFPVAIGLMLIDPVRAQPPQSPVESSNETTATTQSIADPAARGESAPDQPPVPIDASKVWPDVAMPRVVVKLRDAKDQTVIAGASVRIRRLNRSTQPAEFDRNVLDATSDEHGVFACYVSDLGEDTRSVMLEIAVPGRAVALESVRVQKTAEQTNMATVDLWPGQEISTRVFDANGKPADDARVRLLADIGSGSYTMWSGYATCDAAGRLTTQIPKGCAFGLTVTSERGAPYRVVLPAGTTRISEIYLTRGSVVAGQLLDRDGKPISKCDVVLEAEDTQAINTEFHVGRHGTGSLNLEFQRTTDEQGRFRFPPMSGQVRVYLNCDSSEDLRGQLIPVSVDLPASGETWLPLMLSPTGTVSGTARWEDGSPVKNLDIELLIPPRVSNSYITLGEVQTDAEGHYKMPVPFPVNDIRMTAGRMQGPDQRYWVARPVTANGPQSNMMKQLSRYVGESLTVDWVMTPDERDSSKQRTAPRIEPAWQPLADLELEIKQVMSKKRDAREVMTDRCLEFEEQHRGTRLGIGALHYVMRAAATTTAREPQQARERAIQVLADHYMKHPDVDMLITSFDAGSGTMSGEPLLLRLVNESPFDYVRATALLELARHRLLMRHLKENIYNQPEQSAEAQAAMIAIQKSEETKKWLREQYDRGHRMREILGKIDGNSLQQSAIELLERLTTHYIGVAAPVRYFESAAGLNYPELMLVDRVEIPTWRRRTSSEQAEILRFQITRLQPGMKAPEIEGLDLQQSPIRLSQFRGQVVLLTLTLENSERELYAECARIIGAVKDPRFACVSVIPGAGSGGYSARAIVEDGKVTWPIIRDTTEDDIAHLWCQKTFPAVYLIDAEGVIQHITEGNHSIPGILEQVKAQMKLLPQRPQPAE